MTNAHASISSFLIELTFSLWSSSTMKILTIWSSSFDDIRKRRIYATKNTVYCTGYKLLTLFNEDLWDITWTFPFSYIDDLLKKSLYIFAQFSKAKLHSQKQALCCNTFLPSNIKYNVKWSSNFDSSNLLANLGKFSWN